jgi:hypothetical protein
MAINRIWLSKFMVLFGYLMAILYIGLGCALFIPWILPAIPKDLKLTFSFFFIAYGLFRLVKLRPKKTESNE